ncbi:MAG: prepilin-type N-terminal cleavage/methylation domain-containing protein [Planctomycetaceae bacterium]
MQNVKTNRNKLLASHAGRRGFTLFELVISALLLGSVAMAVVPVLHWVQRERIHASQERLALQEAANTLEFFAAKQSQGALTETILNEQRLSDSAQQRLTDGQLHVDMTPEEGLPAAKRITVKVTWETGKGKKSAPVQLSAWFYDAGGTGQ